MFGNQILKLIDIDTDTYEATVEEQLLPHMEGDNTYTMHIDELHFVKINKKMMLDTKQELTDQISKAMEEYQRNQSALQTKLDSAKRTLQSHTYNNRRRGRDHEYYDRHDPHLDDYHDGVDQVTNTIKETKKQYEQDTKRNQDEINQINSNTIESQLRFMGIDLDKKDMPPMSNKDDSIQIFETSDRIVNEKNCMSVSADTFHYFQKEYLFKYIPSSIEFKKLVLMRAASQAFLDDEELSRVQSDRQRRLKQLTKMKEEVDKADIKQTQKEYRVPLQVLQNSLGTQSNLRGIINSILSKKKSTIKNIKFKKDEVATRSFIDQHINFKDNTRIYIL
jgi:hypothetical protein